MEEWFVRRRRSRVLDMAHREISLAIETVAELEKAIAAASVGKRDEAVASVHRLFPKEEEIDGLRRAVFEELTRGSLPFKDREDIMHLVKRLDVMADYVKDSSRCVLVLTEAKIPSELWSMYVEMAKDLVECAATLRRSLEKLGVDPQEARSLSREVDGVEKKVDEKYLKIKGLLLKHGKDVEPQAALLILKDLLEFMEDVADCCDDTADYVRILTVTREKE